MYTVAWIRGGLPSERMIKNDKNERLLVIPVVLVTSLVTRVF
jgi:hypothetical protein